MWTKASLLIFIAFLFASCANNKDFDEAEKLAIEAAMSRDSLQVVVDSLRANISLYEKEYNSLYTKAESLESDTTSLNIKLREVEKRFAKNEQKPKASVSVDIISIIKDLKENSDLTTSHADTSTTVVVADSAASEDTKTPPKIRSFIEYVWNKRNKVEP